MENPIQITTKDPKKVEAGKKLAEYNRQQREKLKAMEEKERREEFMKSSESTELSAPTEPTSSPPSRDNNYELFGIIVAIDLGGVAYFLLIKKNGDKPKKKKKNYRSEQAQVTQIPRVEQIAPVKTRAPTSKFEME